MQTDQVCIAVHKPPKESKGMAHRYLTIPDISSMDISCIPIVISKKQVCMPEARSAEIGFL